MSQEETVDIYQFVKLVTWEAPRLHNLYRYNIVGTIVCSKPIEGIEQTGTLESGNFDASKVIEGYNIEAEELIEAIRFLRKRKAKYQGRDANDCITELISM